MEDGGFLKTADVFVNIPVKSIAKAYTYQVPEGLSFLDSGWRVLVPFGGRKVEGFVVKTADTDKTPEHELKDILAAVDDEAWFTPELIEASRWMASFYLCSLAEMMRLFMPGKSGLKIQVCYAAADSKSPLLAVPCYAAIQQLLLHKGPLGRNQLHKYLPADDDLADHLATMMRAKLVHKEYAAHKRDLARYEDIAVLQQPVDEKLLAAYSRRPAQQKLLRLMQQQPEQRVEALQEQGVSRSILHVVEQEGAIGLRKRRVFRDSYNGFQASREIGELTADQQKAVAAMMPYLKSRAYHAFLLHGVTGSGKTRVYMEAVRAVRQQGRRAIVLVPEIALTGQLVSSFKAWFAQDIIVMHSRLSLAERNDAILRIRRNEAGVIIGARSALFTPVTDVGIIIMDEEQDMSYKQDESPRYHARVVAAKLASLYGAVLLLGSATPSLESYYQAQTGAITLLTMPERIGGRPLPTVECVDMRQELKQGNRRIVSRRLAQLIRTTLAKQEQIIIMLNRRGFSTFVMCRSCGEVIKCPSCGLPLVYHKDGRLLCHHCDEHVPVPAVCPKCGSRYIKYFGSGTEKLEQELRQLVPEARVIRMDRDTTNTKFAHQDILAAFKRGDYDILLGTQMVAKGHDVPSVTAVGIISADSCLNMPDFRAAERCFMLITQTAGRAGRRDKKGTVIVQSYSPEHYAVQCALRQDYKGFYDKEIRLRQELFYPPFSHLVKLIFHDQDEAKARGAALSFRAAFAAAYKKNDDKNQLIGPAPAMIAEFRGVYRFCILLKTAELEQLSAFLRQQGLHLREDVALDIDPLNTM